MLSDDFSDIISSVADLIQMCRKLAVYYLSPFHHLNQIWLRDNQV